MPCGKHLRVVLDVEVVSSDDVIEVVERLRLGHVGDAQQTLTARLESFVVGGGELLFRIELPNRPIVGAALLENDCSIRLQMARMSFRRESNPAGPGADYDEIVHLLIID